MKLVTFSTTLVVMAMIMSLLTMALATMMAMIVIIMTKCDDSMVNDVSWFWKCIFSFDSCTEALNSQFVFWFTHSVLDAALRSELTVAPSKPYGSPRPKP